MSENLKKTASDGHEKMLAVSLSQEQQAKVCPIIEILEHMKIQTTIFWVKDVVADNNLIWCILDHWGEKVDRNIIR